MVQNQCPTFTSSSLAKGADPRYFSITFQSEPGFASTDYVHLNYHGRFDADTRNQQWIVFRVPGVTVNLK